MVVVVLLWSPPFTLRDRQHWGKLFFASDDPVCDPEEIAQPIYPQFLSPENKLDLLSGDQSKSCLRQGEVS